MPDLAALLSLLRLALKDRQQLVLENIALRHQLAVYKRSGKRPRIEMPPRPSLSALPLPRGWSKIVRTGVLHAVSVAAMAMTSAWSKASSGRSSLQRALAEVDRLRSEIALLTEELELKDARWARVPARRRPYYGPVQRMRILQLRAARGWSAKQTADRFLVTEETIASWMRRLDEEGEAGLVQTEEPVNKFPEFVAHLVRYLKRTCPMLGKAKIAQMLARAGLHLGATTRREDADT